VHTAALLFLIACYRFHIQIVFGNHVDKIDILFFGISSHACAVMYNTIHYFKVKLLHSLCDSCWKDISPLGTGRRSG